MQFFVHGPEKSHRTGAEAPVGNHNRVLLTLCYPSPVTDPVLDEVESADNDGDEDEHEQVAGRQQVQVVEDRTAALVHVTATQTRVLISVKVTSKLM